MDACYVSRLTLAVAAVGFGLSARADVDCVKGDRVCGADGHVYQCVHLQFSDDHTQLRLSAAALLFAQGAARADVASDAIEWLTAKADEHGRTYSCVGSAGSDSRSAIIP
jgi:hypothetical protein